MTSPTAEQMAELQKKATTKWSVQVEGLTSLIVAPVQFRGSELLVSVFGPGVGDQQDDNAKFAVAARDFDFTTATANERRVRELEEKLRDYVDTVHACLIAAGGSEDIDELERQVNAAGPKPSFFVRKQIQAHARENERLREALEKIKTIGDGATSSPSAREATMLNIARAALSQTEDKT